MGRANRTALKLLLGSAGLVSAHVETSSQAPHVKARFEQFVKDFGKTYKSVEEKEARLAIFAKNLLFIAAENAKGHSYELGVTRFADLTADEFAETYTGLRSTKSAYEGLPYLGRHVPSNTTLPTSVDWRSQGAVTPVKNQQQCGSCWAFSSTGALEGAWKIATGKLVSLSEQQLVDCSSSFGNQGCNGGEMDAAFQYAEQTGFCTEGSYPYQAAGGTCAASSCTVAIPQGSVSGFKDVSPSDTQALMDAVAQQPVSVAIEADKAVFQLYKSGVLSSTCGTSLDHGVLAVGYGTYTDGTDYWMVKNSWGASWGMDGYVLLKRGKAGVGECGIKAQPSYPVVKAAVPQDASMIISDAEVRFEQFIKDHGKTYKDAAEKEARLATFARNLLYIATENAKGHSYTLGVNKYADLTAEEFGKLYTGLRQKTSPFKGLPYLGRHVPSNATLPTSVDWRSQGAVTPVKNQQQCGSCWAFSSTGALEGAWKIATGKLVSLSEQQLVDCSSSFGNQGCNGGEMDAAFQYAEQTGFCTEDSYPYQAAGGTCAASSCTVAIAQGGVTGYKDVAAEDTQALMDAVAQQPVSVAIEADQSAFQLYQSGVLSAGCGTNLDHGVLAVGYGTYTDGTDYWIVKNSWGASWGMDGYVLLKRGNAGAGECGIKSQPSYPVVKAAAGVINI